MMVSILLYGNHPKTTSLDVVLTWVLKELLLRDKKIKPIAGEIIRTPKPENKDSISKEPHQLDGNNSGFYLMWQGGCLGCLIPAILVILTLFFMLRI